MGTDIHTWAVDKDGNDITSQGNWDDHEPWGWRNYSVFGWLAGERNYSAMKPIAEDRGWEAYGNWKPTEEDLDWNYGHSWVSIEELNKIDYGAEVEDRRCARTLDNGIISGGCTCGEGGGVIMSLREFLGNDFFSDLEELKRIGASRVYFNFDC